ncbi:hypothetical protein ACQSSU_20375 [Micromonospora echinospora]
MPRSYYAAVATGTVIAAGILAAIGPNRIKSIVAAVPGLVLNLF